jgi:hypothetical protein
MTLMDWHRLKVGDVVDVVLWDRNWEEACMWDTAEEGKVYDARDFFKCNRAQFKVGENYEWALTDDAVVGAVHPLHVNISTDGGGHDTTCTWLPVGRDGAIGTPEPKNRSFHVLTHIDSLPLHTRVGWRGPVMLWSKLEHAPPITYTEGYHGQPEL